MKTSVTREEVVGVFNDQGYRQEAERYLNDKSKLEGLLEQASDFLEKVPLVGEYLTDFPTACLLVKDYASGNYRDISKIKVTVSVIALIYLVSPVDLIPDAIPIVGFVDDAAILTFAFRLIHEELVAYRKWRIDQSWYQ